MRRVWFAENIRKRRGSNIVLTAMPARGFLKTVIAVIICANVLNTRSAGARRKNVQNVRGIAGRRTAVFMWSPGNQNADACATYWNQKLGDEIGEGRK